MSETGSGGGFLLLDKPPGLSSFQALRPVKRAFPKAKVGHAGTLDPAASGLLIAGVAAGTRLLEYLEGMPKTYAFTAHFGFVSDTYDCEGEVRPYADVRPAAAPAAAAIAEALAAFRGRIRQTPPAYSAIKIDGERAYARARAGESVALAPREVEILSLELKAFHSGTEPAAGEETALPADVPAVTGAAFARATAGGGALRTHPMPAGFASAARADLIMTCSKGTYVRSLVHDLGKALGCGAVTGALRRLAIGPFRVDDAVAPKDVKQGARLLPLETAVAHLPAALIPAGAIGSFLNGQAVIPERPAHGAPESDVRAHAPDGRLLAIARLAEDGRCAPRKVLAVREDGAAAHRTGAAP